MPAANHLVLSPDVSIDGTPVPAAELDMLLELRVSRSLGVPSELTMRLVDENFELIDGSRFVVGAVVEVKFPDPAGNATMVFDGEIVSVGVDQRAGMRGCELTLTALDLAHRLARGTQVRTFQKQKYSDVVSKIAQEHGLRADVTATNIIFDYLIQTTTDYAFLQQLAFRTGYEWRVEGKRLSFRPRASTAPVATLKYGEELRSLRARYTAGSEATQVTVRAWDPLTKRAVVGVQPMAAARSGGMNGSSSNLVSGGRTKAAAFSKGVSSSSLVATSSDEATELAKALAGRVATADASLRCECLGDPRITDGSTVKIEGAGTKLSGEYYVTSVEHVFGRDGDLTTTFATGPADSSSIVELLGGGAERVNPFGQLGLTIGIVTNNRDPEGVGRVRVKFPALSDSEESWWARVVAPGAGSSAGLMFMPQIDDEVLVGFEHGDMRRPFVLGGLWGAKAKPPTAHDRYLAQNKVVEWGVRTLNGSTLAIRSGDQPADKHYKFALPDGTTHYMGSDKTEIIAQNKSIELKSGQASIKITDRGDIEIKGNNIKIEATQNLTLDGLQIAAKAKTSLKAEGSATIELKGGASAKLEASGITEVKGSLVKIQ